MKNDLVKQKKYKKAAILICKNKNVQYIFIETNMFWGHCFHKPIYHMKIHKMNTQIKRSSVSSFKLTTTISKSGIYQLILASKLCFLFYITVLSYSPSY
jgi:hypothetical protein